MGEPNDNIPSPIGDDRPSELIPAPHDTTYEPELFVDIPEAQLGAVGHVDSPPRASVSPLRVFRYKWSILLVTVLVAAAGIPSVWLLVKPRYKARAVVRVSPVVSRIVFRTESNAMVPLYQSFLNTQVSIIRSSRVLQRVLDRTDVKQSKWFNEDEKTLFGPAPGRLERLGEALSVMPRRKTELIDVSVMTRGAGAAKVLVDAVVDEYIRHTAETVNESEIERLATLRQERDRLEIELRALRDRKFVLAKGLRTNMPDELWAQRSAHLNVLQNKRVSLFRELALVRFDLEALDRRSAADADSEVDEVAPDGPPELGAKQRYALDTEWRMRSLDEQEAVHALDMARQQLGERHPRIAQLGSEVDHAGSLRLQREQQLDSQYETSGVVNATVSNRAVSVSDRPNLERQAARLAREIELVDEEIDQQIAAVASVGDIAKEIADSSEQISQRRALYDQVVGRLKELTLEGKAPARISIAAKGIAPSRPARDRRIVLTFVVLFGALASGIGLAYGRVALDSRIREVSDVCGSVHRPFLGQLPPLPVGQQIMSDCGPVIMENVRIVRTALLERLGRQDHRVILVTSASVGAGKTTVSVLLARSLAHLGKKTLLVEADLRRPSLSQQLEMATTPGLAALLTGSVDEKSVIMPTDLDRLDIIPAGVVPDRFSTEMLANGVFSACLRRWRDEYDYVLLDSPPIPIVADARIMASQVDGSLLVLRSAHCRRTEAVQAYMNLMAAGSSVLGTILVGGSGADRYGYYAYEGETPSLSAG